MDPRDPEGATWTLPPDNSCGLGFSDAGQGEVMIFFNPRTPWQEFGLLWPIGRDKDDGTTEWTSKTAEKGEVVWTTKEDTQILVWGSGDKEGIHHRLPAIDL